MQLHTTCEFYFHSCPLEGFSIPKLYLLQLTGYIYQTSQTCSACCSAFFSVVCKSCISLAHCNRNETKQPQINYNNRNIKGYSLNCIYVSWNDVQNAQSTDSIPTTTESSRMHSKNIAIPRLPIGPSDTCIVK